MYVREYVCVCAGMPVQGWAAVCTLCVVNLSTQARNVLYEYSFRYTASLVFIIAQMSKPVYVPEPVRMSENMCASVRVCECRGWQKSVLYVLSMYLPERGMFCESIAVGMPHLWSLL